MNIDQLEQIVSQGESECLELKTSTTQLKAALETVCAFLNLKGGQVILGVKDNGTLIGQNVSDQTKQEIAKEIRKIEPNAPIDIHYVPFNNELQIIVLDVPEGKHAPYTYDGRPFERTTSTTSRMTQHQYEQLIIKRNYLNHDWEDCLTDEFTIDDLDHQEIKETVEDGIRKNRISPDAIHHNIEQILKNFKLIRDGKLTHAAVVLYAKDPNKIFSRCEIKMARFRGRTKVEGFLDNQWEKGNAFQLITLAHYFANRHLPIASYFEPGKLQRIDQPAVPQLALREALTNAFCHRDYNIRSAATSLAIYDDRLEIWSPGELLPEVQLAQLKRPHSSHQRNELIANVFYQRGWIEKWGTGTTRMLEYCRDNNTPEPEFSEYSSGFSVVFPFKEPMNTGVTIKQPLHTPTIRLTKRQEEILELLKHHEYMSANEILTSLSSPPAPRTLRDDLNHLKQAGLIDSEGHTKKAVWIIVK
ncbi:TPA: putative DNA binding domain-containing protein [Legionella pneumophila]|uniref:ATP-binding protein n=1 Tax=Legionella longbeachae TaxID=450 RepID=UPI0001BEBCAC|nr:ATP-binding protein [Legionella longbeachae]EEZ95974.1 putative ATP-dependent DNA helicase [Legionella longbeachae D-4968]HEO1516590.1 putative DNA binding domain-containing protein [Legionella pneumophila]